MWKTAFLLKKNRTKQNYSPLDFGGVFGCEDGLLLAVTCSPVAHCTNDTPPIPLSSLVDEVLAVTSGSG